MNAVAKSSGLAAAILALAVAWPAHAEKADRERPVNIESDTLRVDDANKTAVYEGNVVLTQGTLFMTADRLDVRQDDKGFTSSEAYGLNKPVFFRQKQEAKDQYIEGTGNRIEYDAANDVVKLIGSARVRRGDEEVRGNLIVYDAKTETYRAVGTTKEGGNGRVRAVIKPKQKDASGKGEAKP